MKTLIIHAISLAYFTLFSCPAIGQGEKILTQADFALWSYLSPGELSGNGKWASYSVAYHSGADTLFVKSTAGRAVFSFPKSNKGRFFGKDKFIFLKTGVGLQVTDLRSGSKFIIGEVSRYEIIQGDRILVESSADSTKQLTVYGEEGSIQFSLKNVGSWSYNSKSDALICQVAASAVQSLYLIRLSKQYKSMKITGLGNEIVSDFSWKQDGQAVAFLRHYNDSTGIGLYRLPNSQYHKLEPEGLSTGKVFLSTSFTPLQISSDGSKVFFGIGDKTFVDSPERVQVWNSLDKAVYPTKVMLKGFEALNKVVCWEPDNDRILQITNNEFPNCMIAPNGEHALLWNIMAYQPQQKHSGDIDIWLLDMQTGIKKLLLTKQVGSERHIFFSPGGRYLNYYRDEKWWVYDINKAITVDLTGKLAVTFSDDQHEWSGDVPAYGTPGWTKGDEAVLLYDQFDLWKIDVNGKASRLTKGRESNTAFRIIPQDKTQRNSQNSSGQSSAVFDLSKEIWLAGNTNGRTTTMFHKWNNVTGNIPVVTSKNSLSYLMPSAKSGEVMYLEQSYNLPPRLMYSNGAAPPKVVFQGNPQHFNYNWSKAEVVTYQDSKGNLLRGVLYYPSGFDKNKTYPVVVHIYEKYSHLIHQYVSPSLHAHDGFNRSKLVAEGYFVFEPDISYELGNPGLSAVDCITNAVNEIIGVRGVDSDRIGLIGHSFGGYETMMLIGKTKLFKAAIAGSGVADLTTQFLFVNEGSSRSNNWFFESGQLRMKGSLFDFPEDYAANSPLNFVKEIDTPLLLWTGSDDTQVPPGQSMEMYLALRRLEKPGIMLIYPGERHNILRSDHQKDLTRRVQEWFGHFLKDEAAPDWMQPDQF